MRHALICSVAVHTTVIALAVGTSASPRVVREPRERVETVRLPTPAPDAAQTTPPPPARSRVSGFQVVVAPLEVPTAVPEISFVRPTTVEADFSGSGVAGGVAVGPIPGVGTPGLELRELFEETEVDLRPFILPGQMGPTYPEPLRNAAPDGAVVVGFVLDTAGRLEPQSLRVVRASHPLFAEAVLGALARLRYAPAQTAGRKVRVRLEQRFEFHLAR